MLYQRFKGFSFPTNIKEKESVYSWERRGGGWGGLQMAAHLGALTQHRRVAMNGRRMLG